MNYCILQTSLFLLCMVLNISYNHEDRSFAVLMVYFLLMLLYYGFMNYLQIKIYFLKMYIT